MYQPQVGWGGQQFYQAQAGLGYGADDFDDFEGGGLFDSVWRGGRREFDNGLASEEARRWHRRIYGGMVQIGQVEAEELGAAAGYEAFRQWSAYGNTYRGPLGGGADREVEALAGIAAGEVRRLVASSFGGRLSRRSFLREAAEIAVSTAYRLMQDMDEDGYGGGGMYGGRRRRLSGMGMRRRRSFSAYGEDPYMDGGVGPGALVPVSSALTGGGISAQLTGVSYASPYVQGGQLTGGMYPQQAQYVNGMTGQPISYAQPGVQYMGQAGYGAGYAVAQPQYVQAGGMGYAQPYTGGYGSRRLSTGYGAPGYIM